MCKHSNLLTPETCATCQEQSGNAHPEPEQADSNAHPEPIYVGLDKIDREAARWGNRTRGFKFHKATRIGARGRRRGRNGGE